MDFDDLSDRVRGVRECRAIFGVPRIFLAEFG